MSSPALDEMVGSSDLLSSFDVDEMATEALLFQTGYLTVRGEEDLGGEPIHLVAVEFSKATRNIVGFAVEEG